MNESVNYEAVCRTAPATPGLLKKNQTFLFLEKFVREHIVLLLELWLWLHFIYDFFSSSSF